MSEECVEGFASASLCWVKCFICFAYYYSYMIILKILMISVENVWKNGK